MTSWKKQFEPKHRAREVAEMLENGLRDGSIVLDSEEESDMKKGIVERIDPRTGAQYIRHGSGVTDIIILSSIDRVPGLTVGTRGTLQYRATTSRGWWEFTPDSGTGKESHVGSS